MGKPSEKAIEAAGTRLGGDYNSATIEIVAAAMHDPSLGLDRSVCLRDVVWALEHRPYPLGEEEYSAPARFIEREFGGGT